MKSISLRVEDVQVSIEDKKLRAQARRSDDEVSDNKETCGAGCGAGGR